MSDRTNIQGVTGFRRGDVPLGGLVTPTGDGTL